MIYYSIPEQFNFTHNVYDEKAMYPLWELQGGNQFISSTGKTIEVVSPGKRNRFSGPDYKHACILIQGEVYIGDVELHESTEGWYHHKHEENAEYNNVILHISSHGAQTPIRTNNKKWVETIHLPLFRGKIISCDNIIDAYAVSEIESILKMGAYTRWLQHCTNFNDESDGFNRIFYLLDIRNRQIVSEYIDSLKQINSISDSNFKQLYNSLISRNYEKGSRFPSATLEKRVPFIMAITLLYLRDPLSLSEYSSLDLLDVQKSLIENGFQISGQAYLNEIMGNIILPLRSQYAPEENDNFEQWYNLPVQAYGNCTRKMKQWGVNLPRTFGLQQGVLYQIENCCKIHQAFQCPFINIEN